MERVLPEDIILDIFSRVPFESLCECKLVSKTWKNFISQLSKVNLSPSSPSDNSKVSYISINNLEFLTVQLLLLEYDNEQELTISKINHPLISRRRYGYQISSSAPFFKINTMIIDSSNGLICLSIPRKGKFGATDDDSLYICNPVTREYVSLRIPMCSEKCSKGRNVFGFGYNDKTNEYKVVRIFYESEKHTERGQVYVYTLGAGTGWRSKGHVAYSLQTNNSYSPGMNADGEVYWLHQGILEKDYVSGERIRSNEGRVVAFNLAEEEFWLLPETPYHATLSDDEKFAAFFYRQIQVLGGCLCYFHAERCDTINIWSFKKKNGSSSCSFNEKEEDSSSWSLEGTVHLERDHLAQFFDLTKSGEILYWDDKRAAFSYDLRTAREKGPLNDGTTALKLDVVETIRHECSFVSLKALGEEDVKMFDRIK